jgi:hypothetical protein
MEVPFDRPDPAGSAQLAPFADVAECLDGLIRCVAREAEERLAAEHLALGETPEPGAEAWAWFEAVSAETRRRGDEPPLLRAFRAWSLPVEGQRLVGAALGAELDAALGERLRALAPGSDGLTLGALARLANRPLLDVARALAPDGSLGRLELVAVDDTGVLASRRARPSERLLRLAAGDAAPDPASELGFERAPASPPPAVFADAALELLAALAGRAAADEPIALVAAPPGFGVHRALADELTGAGLAVLGLQLDATPRDRAHAARVAREARLWGGALVVDATHAIAAPWLASWIDALAVEVSALFVTVEGLAIAAPATRATWARVDADVPPVEVRALLLAESLGGASPEALVDCAASFTLGPAALRAVGTLVRRAAGDEPLRQSDFLPALTAYGAGRLGPLATPIAVHAPADDLVVSDEVGERLVEIAGLARRRERDLGVCALFTGPAGSGKLLAWELVARALGLPVHVVDAAALSPWTPAVAAAFVELTRAAEVWPSTLAVVHADALAPAEQRAVTARLERFRGASLFACDQDGAEHALRTAFSCCVHFPPPTETQRAALLRAWLPDDAVAERRVDPADVARRHALPRARLRELVRRAVALAQAAGEPLTTAWIQKAADRPR